MYFHFIFLCPHRYCINVGFKAPFILQKKCGPDPLKSGQDQFFLTVYMGNDQARLMIERTPGPRNLYTVYTADSCCLDQIFI